MMKAMGKEIPMKADGVILSDGPGFDLLIAGMGLKEGDEVAFYKADMMAGKASQFVIKHHGTEAVEDGGANYEKITVTSMENAADVTTMWIDSSQRRAAKMTQVIPAMGNAVMTVILK
jgi:hypothetical protein